MKFYSFLLKIKNNTYSNGKYLITFLKSSKESDTVLATLIDLELNNLGFVEKNE